MILLIGATAPITLVIVPRGNASEITGTAESPRYEIKRKEEL
jgi:hypothetical protein